MLHILLLIFKIIGIIIAVILGLILLLGLVILFVPIRYSIDADYHKKAVAHIKVTWILHLLRVAVSYDEQLNISAKALWFNLYSNGDSKEEQTTQSKPQKKNNTSKSKKTKKENQLDKPKEKQYQQEQKVSATSTDDNVDVSKLTDKDNVVKEANKSNDDNVIQKDALEKKQESTTSINKADEDENQKDNNSVKHNTTKKKKSKNISSKINSIIDKIKGVYHKIKGLLISVYNTVKGVINKSQSAIDKVKKKYNEIKKKVTDPENIELVKFLWKQVKAGLNIIKPSKYDINIRYGFEDSSMTGWLAVRLAVIYGILGLDMNIIPDFDNSIFEGDVYMKGSFNIFSMLVIAIRLYKNKSFRKLIKR